MARRFYLSMISSGNISSFFFMNLFLGGEAPRWKSFRFRVKKQAPRVDMTELNKYLGVVSSKVNALTSYK